MSNHHDFAIHEGLLTNYNTGQPQDGIYPYGVAGSRLYVPFTRVIVEGLSALQPVAFARDYLRDGRRVWTPVGQALLLRTDGTVGFGPEPSVVAMALNSPMRYPLLARTIPGRETEVLNRLRTWLEGQHRTTL